MMERLVPWRIVQGHAPSSDLPLAAVYCAVVREVLKSGGVTLKAAMQSSLALYAHKLGRDDLCQAVLRSKK